MKYAIWLVAALAQLAGVPAASAEMVRIRGTLIEFDTSKITVAERDGGVEPIGVDSNTRYLSVTPVDIDAIKPGSYIGVAGLPQPDGTIKALGVMVFPEQARGMNEGSFPWDLQPDSTMTNATVAKVETEASGREVQVTFKGETQTIDIVDASAIASFEPASASALVEGAKVTVFVEQGVGLPTARSVLIGMNGLTPPN
jgi:hypothetical protein